MTWNKKQKYIKTDGWRGYLQPIYAVCGWNDTGTWSDSPCNSNDGQKEGNLVRQFLREHGINFRTVWAKTSNVFCIHRYIIVPVEMFDKARELLEHWYENGIKEKTRLLYLC